MSVILERRELIRVGDVMIFGINHGGNEGVGAKRDGNPNTRMLMIKLITKFNDEAFG